MHQIAIVPHCQWSWSRLIACNRLVTSPHVKYRVSDLSQLCKCSEISDSGTISNYQRLIHQKTCWMFGAFCHASATHTQLSRILTFHWCDIHVCIVGIAIFFFIFKHQSLFLQWRKGCFHNTCRNICRISLFHARWSGTVEAGVFFGKISKDNIYWLCKYGGVQ